MPCDSAFETYPTEYQKTQPERSDLWTSRNIMAGNPIVDQLMCQSMYIVENQKGKKDG